MNILFRLKNTFQFSRIHHTILKHQKYIQEMDNRKHHNIKLNHHIIQLTRHLTQHIHLRWLKIQMFQIITLHRNSTQDLSNLFQMFSTAQILNFTSPHILEVAKNISFAKTTGYIVINVVKVSTGITYSTNVTFLLKHSVIPARMEKELVSII